MPAVELRDWMSYEPIWLASGVGLLCLLIAWHGLVLWLTRRRRPRSLNTLRAKPLTVPDLSTLQARYLRLIDEVEAAYTERRLSTRQAHQKLSYLLRRFVYEVRGHRADTLTLADLMQTRYHQLAAAVQRYYLPEFARLEHGDTAEALRIAREVISTWH